MQPIVYRPHTSTRSAAQEGLVVSEFHGLSEVAVCLFLLTQEPVRDAPAVVGIGVLRIEAYGFVEVLNRTPVLAEVGVREAPVVVGIGILWIEADGLVEVLLCPGDLAHVDYVHLTRTVVSTAFVCRVDAHLRTVAIPTGV